jgi:NAD(P)-dependent dehydrogenase (short-subunit alcohol dehydrogenase family)
MDGILLTGAASGIGLAAAKRLLAEGHTVIGIDRRWDGTVEGLRAFTADVTDYESLKGVADVLRAEGITLRAIVSVAGVHAMHAFAEGDAAVADRVISVNLLGAMHTVRAFHPLLAKDGRAVLVTSEVATLEPLPFNGLYSVSKTALECYAQALRQELGLLGQKVVTVRPGAVKTPLADGSATATRRLAEETALYQRQAGKFEGIVSRFTGTPLAPDAFAPTLCRAILAKRPRLSYAKHRNPGLLLLGHLPKRMQCAIVRWLLR